MRLLLIPLLPFIGFLINATVGRRWPQKLTGGIATAAMAGAFGVMISPSDSSKAGAWSPIDIYVGSLVAGWAAAAVASITLSFLRRPVAGLFMGLACGLVAGLVFGFIVR